MTGKLYKLMDWPKMEQIIASECDNPHEVLGPHRNGYHTLIQTFFPEVEKVAIVFEDKWDNVQMEQLDESGYFAALIPEKELPKYYYMVKKNDGTTERRDEAYRFAPLISKSDTDKFKNGIYYSAYNKLGAHPMAIDGVKGTYFAVWAPSAIRVSVVGDFNGWDGRVHQMRRLWDSGIFEIFVPGAKIGDNYKFELKLRDGLTYLKADPYGNAAQLRPETASVITDLYGFVWEDGDFIEKRMEFQTGNVPVSIYELYLGSFMGSPINRLWATYREIADRLIPYIKKMNYTHVELMPIMEHPFDHSWGYQTIGYYAPTARYGSPDDFMYLVNELHKAGIGVILDWSPAYFPKDIHGLSSFDGTCLYEHFDWRRGTHLKWDIMLYNYGRPEVSNYLIANALFWVEKYHVDGIRVNAVSSMLYLDYEKKEGEWLPNMYGGNENLEAIEMLKHLNSIMKKRNPGVLMIAEEESAFPLVTESLEKEGLGFDLKWNPGFVGDYLSYVGKDPYFRNQYHSDLTLSMIYAYSEKFILAFSHGDVVQGRGTMIEKMPGEEVQKFANLRLSYAYMMCHPGKKLLFMGQDIAEPEEWNEERCVGWELLENPRHEGVRKMVSDLNALYRENPALYALDDNPKGFEWINPINAKESCLSFLRRGTEDEQFLLIVANFSGVAREVTVGVPCAGQYEEIFNSDREEYGGTGFINYRIRESEPVSRDERPNSLTVKTAALSLGIFRLVSPQ